MDWMDNGGEGEEGRLTQPYLVASQCDMINLMGKIVITSEKRIIKNSDYLTNILVNTCDTVAQVQVWVFDRSEILYL